jgi:dihydrofolate reductase
VKGERTTCGKQLVHPELEVGKRIGSPAASQSLMQLDLIDSYWIFVNPIIFGRGIPLFAGTTNKSKLRLLTTKQFANGEIALNYVLERHK